MVGTGLGSSILSSIYPSTKKEGIANGVKSLLKKKFTSRRQQGYFLGVSVVCINTDPVFKVTLRDMGRIWRNRMKDIVRDKVSDLPRALFDYLKPWKQ